MSEEKKIGIKELSEALDMVKMLAVGGAKVWKDGKISTSDLGVLVDLAKRSDEILEGMKDIDLVDDEIRDLDEQEIVQVIAKVYEVFRAVKEARK